MANREQRDPAARLSNSPVTPVLAPIFTGAVPASAVTE
jgi:hypothetical protein